MYFLTSTILLKIQFLSFTVPPIISQRSCYFSIFLIDSELKVPTILLGYQIHLGEYLKSFSVSYILLYFISIFSVGVGVPYSQLRLI